METITTPGSTVHSIRYQGLARSWKRLEAWVALLRQGWRPKRTIIYCAWDGEEEGLLGSTEWAEDHADELIRKAAVYINSDENGRGFLNVAGSHTLEKFINSVAREVKGPGNTISRFGRDCNCAVSKVRVQVRPEPRRSRIARKRASALIYALTPLVPVRTTRHSLTILAWRRSDLGFGGEDAGGIYHSIYDDFKWYTHFDDRISVTDAHSLKLSGFPFSAWRTQK